MSSFPGEVHVDSKYQSAFLTIMPNLRANPKSFADRLGQRHDAEVHGQTYGHSGNRSAAAHYYKGWGDGLLTGEGGFYDQPIDSVVDIFGAALFAFEDLLYDVGDFFNGFGIDP